MPPGIGSLLLRLAPAAVFRTLPGFVLDILGLHFDCRIVLDVLFLNLHMLVAALLQLLLHTLVEGWLHTLLEVAPRASRTVGRTLGRSVRTQLVVVLVAQVLEIAMPLALSGIVTVVLGVQ